MTNQEIDAVLQRHDFPPAPGDRIKRIETALVADLKPVRPMAPASVYLASFAGIFIAMCAAGGYLAGQSGWHALSGVQKICVFAPLVASIAFLVFSIVRQMTPAAKYVRSSALLSAASFGLLLLAIAAVFEPRQEPGFLRSGLACFRTGLVFAVPAAFLFGLLLLRGARLSPALTGAMSGGLAGLVGLAVLEIHCPNLNVVHIVTWHVSVTLVCALVGFIFSGVTFRRRTSNQ